MRQYLATILLLLSIISSLSGQELTQTVHIDSIVIKKNWRTKDKIILKELDFKAGDTVTPQMMDESIKKLWNIQNFADVRYSLDTLENNKIVLTIIAKDAFTIVPIFSFNGNKKDFNLALGIDDQNFLGKNIRLRFIFSTGTNGQTYHVGATIPRQLLYKNMTLSGNLSYGYGVNNTYNSEREQTSSTGYRIKSFSGAIGNPFHTDFKYTFSPDFNWNLFQHKTDTTVATPGVPTPDDYVVNYLALGFSESIGTITHFRHQEDGYNISGNISLGVGLDKNSPFYQSFSLSASYQKLFNKVIQFSSSFQTAYTTSNVPSLKYNIGSSRVKGIYQGEIAGKAYYTFYAGGHFTYINKKWFALEHSVYVNMGNGKDVYSEIFSTAPLFAVGTGVNLMIPMIPWLYIRFFFSYSGKNSNWFNVEF